MKTRVSATIDEEVDEALDKIMKRGKHRNKSHVIEDAIRFYLEHEK